MQFTPALDWNELRLVLAVVRAGGLKSAAAALAIDHSTVFRRLRQLEAGLGEPLFERLPGGAYLPTELAQKLAATAERIDDEVLALEREIAGSDRRLAGTLRVTSSETLAHGILMPHIAAFHRLHPGLVINLTIDNRVLNLTRREADIALRPVRPKEPSLWGRRISDVAWAIYGQAGGPAMAADGDPGGAGIIGWEEGADGIAAARWLAAAFPAARIAYRSNSLINQLAAVRAGLGVAVLPCYVGDREPGLVRARPEPIEELRGELWMVTHSDLRRTARIRAFFEVMGERLAGERALFEGDAAAVGA